MSLMNVPIMFQEYNHSLLSQKDDGLGHNICIIDS